MSNDQKTILIVDDTPTTVGIISAALKDQFKTKVATNGEKAMALANADEKPDLILLDVMMPIMDGYEVCRRIKANSDTREIPIIFLTAKTDVEDEKKGFELGAVDYIHKPFSAPIVLARVTTHIALQVTLRRAQELTHQLRLANEELEQRVAAALMREQARQAELARVTRITTTGVLAASIAHEINQPLAAVATNSNAAQRWLSHAPPNLEEARAALERITEDCHRASRVIESVLSMFKKDAGRRDLLVVNAIIEDTLILLHDVIQKHHVSVSTELDDLPGVVADQTQLQQVFINLILNAVEAMTVMPNGNQLGIKTVVTDRKSVLVTVTDTGTGIDTTHASRIFDAFFTTKLGGTGIGLSICRSIVEDHGGRLWASQRVPHGSAFHVELPIAS
jgi:signal transduction histidine kinase